MLNFHDRPIKQKLVITTMTVVAAALLVAGLGVVLADRILFLGEIRRDLSALSSIVAGNTTAALAFNDPEAAARTLRTLKARPHVSSACVYRLDTSILAKYSKDGATACPAPKTGESIESIGGNMTVSQPVVLNGGRIGTLTLLYNLGELRERVRLYAATVLGVLLASFLLALPLSAKLRGVIAAPMSRLVKAATSVAETGNYAIRAPKLSSDELGILVDRFNEMLAGIQSRDADLKKALDDRETALREQKEKEEELRLANADLQQFAYSASHDLREPIRNVAVYSEIVARRYGGVLDADGRQFLEFLREGGRRLATLVDALLAYTRASTIELSESPADSSAALADATASLAEAIRENGATVTSDPLPETFMGQAHLQLIFQNLIGNALKFRGADAPRIHISAAARGPFWCFSVSDNGIGIDPRYKERIFGLFKRLHHDRSYAGTGMGLAICQRLVERYGGRIWVESEPGKGATFFFTVPGTARYARKAVQPSSGGR
jgi:signal transduction histidine kinase